MIKILESNSYESGDYIIQYNEITGLWDVLDLNTHEIVDTGFSSSDDAEESVNLSRVDPSRVVLEEDDDFVVYKVWRSYTSRTYVYTFAKSKYKPSDNVRYSSDSIVKGSQKDVPTFTEDEAKEMVKKFNDMSRERGYPPTWKYDKKWW